MNADVLATVSTGVGVLIGVWRIVTVQVDSVRRDLTAQIAAVDNKLSAAIRDVNNSRNLSDSGPRNFTATQRPSTTSPGRSGDEPASSALSRAAGVRGP